MLETQVCYNISLDHIAQHLLKITLSIQQPLINQQLAMPNWVPGSYMIRDFSKNIVSLSAKVGHENLVVEKLNKSLWQIALVQEVPELIVEYTVYCYDSSPRGAFADLSRVFFDGCYIFLEALGKSETKINVNIDMPKDWQCITSMPIIADNKFIAPNYLALIDHPVTMGKPKLLEFNIANTLHQISISGILPQNVDFERLVTDVSAICANHINFFGELPKMNKYLFILHINDNGHGGIEHSDSTSLLSSRRSLPLLSDKVKSDAYIGLLSLFSHEYFHLWNVKRIKPAVFIKPNLQAEVYTRQLWIFEGITSYYDDFGVLKAKCITVEQYLVLLAKTINRVVNSPGARVQNLEESSFEAWGKFYKQDENAVNSIVSYYAKGAIVALCLDILLMQKTNCQHGLQSVLQALWQEFGKHNIGLLEGQFEKMASNIAGTDLSDFFDLMVRSVEILPLQEYLQAVGVNFKRAPNSIFDELGIRLKAGTNRVYAVVNGKIAVDVGINPGDEIIAIDHIRVSHGNFEANINAYIPGNKISVQVFRDNILLNIHLTIPMPQQERVQLTFVSNKNNLIQQKWLS
jgi:predicted metalloprotease with PDZ domain